MSVVFDPGCTVGHGNSGGGSSITFNLTGTANTTAYIAVRGSAQPTAITVGGSSTGLSHIGTYSASFDTFDLYEMPYSGGTQSVVVTLPNTQQASAVAATWQGILSTGTVQVLQATGSSLTQTSTGTIGTGGLVIQFFGAASGYNENVLSAVSGGTNHYNQSGTYYQAMTISDSPSNATFTATNAANTGTQDYVGFAFIVTFNPNVTVSPSPATVTITGGTPSSRFIQPSPIALTMAQLQGGHNIDLLFFGDSTTDGIGGDGLGTTPDGIADSLGGWVGRMGSAIGAEFGTTMQVRYYNNATIPTAAYTGYTTLHTGSSQTISMHNGGIGGAAASYLYDAATVNNLFCTVSNPTLITYFMGINDSKASTSTSSYVASMAQFITAAQAAYPGIPIITGPDPVTDAPDGEVYSEVLDQAWATYLGIPTLPTTPSLLSTNIAGVYFCDLKNAVNYTYVAGDSYDGTHPNGPGYQIYANWVLGELFPQVSPSPASVAISGVTPVEYQGKLVTPTAATVTITGGTPTEQVGLTIHPQTATLTLSGGTPRVLIPVVVQPNTAHLTLTGGVPVIDIVDLSPVIVAPTGVLHLEGGTPLVYVTGLWHPLDNKRREFPLTIAEQCIGEIEGAQPQVILPFTNLKLRAPLEVSGTPDRLSGQLSRQRLALPVESSPKHRWHRSVQDVPEVFGEGENRSVQELIPLPKGDDQRSAQELIPLPTGDDQRSVQELVPLPTGDDQRAPQELMSLAGPDCRTPQQLQGVSPWGHVSQRRSQQLTGVSPWGHASQRKIPIQQQRYRR